MERKGSLRKKTVAEANAVFVCGRIAVNTRERQAARGRARREAAEEGRGGGGERREGILSDSLVRLFCVILFEAPSEPSSETIEEVIKNPRSKTQQEINRKRESTLFSFMFFSYALHPMRFTPRASPHAHGDPGTTLIEPRADANDLAPHEGVHKHLPRTRLRKRRPVHS